jgi:hypothetical protein
MWFLILFDDDSVSSKVCPLRSGFGAAMLDKGRLEALKVAYFVSGLM